MALLAVGCGGAKHADPKDVEGVQRTVHAAFNAFINADGTELCDQLTPAARSALVAVMTDRVPLMKGRSCGRQFLAIYRHVPVPMQPRAMQHVQNWNGDGVTIDGDTAKARLEDDNVWELRRIGGHWLVDHFRILPGGWTDPSKQLTD